jgi:hypothetical protein
LRKVIKYLAVSLALVCIFNSGIALSMTMYFDEKWSSQICAKNYEAGGVATESYTDATSIDMATSINSQEGGQGCSYVVPTSTSFLIASLNSSVVGKAHIAWTSSDPIADPHGHHRIISRSVNDLAGEFSVINLIHLNPNASSGETGTNYLPCI